MGRPGLAPGIYFRLLLVGYFEGLDSERAIAWRAADSLTLRDFLGLAFPDAPPEHSTISRTRRLIDLETHRDMFTWVLKRLGEAGLVNGKTIAIDATTLEANAALRHIVRRDTGESYQEFLTTLAQASGIETPTRADLARLDRKRKKKGSNKHWTSPADPDARITKMKDGRTPPAHKAEHAVDLDTGAIVAVTIQGADQGDTATLPETLAETVEQLDRVTDADGEPVAVAEEVVADKGCHTVGRWSSSCAHTDFVPTSASPTAARNRGSNKRATPSMAIAAASAATAASASYDAAGNGSNAALLTPTTRAACGARICGAPPISSSEYSSTPAASISGWSCDVSSASGRRAVYKAGWPC
jgi:transposase